MVRSPTAVVFESQTNNSNSVVFVWEFDGKDAVFYPSDIPLFSKDEHVEIARLVQATSAGLSFEMIKASLPLNIGDRVLVLQRVEAGEVKRVQATKKAIVESN